MTSPSFIRRIEANTHHWLDVAARSGGPTDGLPDRDWPNILQSLHFGLQHPETEAGAAELWRVMIGYVQTRGYLGTWQTIAEQVADRLDTLPLPLACRVANELGFFFRNSQDLQRAYAMHRFAMQHAPALGDRFQHGLAQLGLGNLQVVEGKYAEAEASVHAALGLLEGIDGAAPDVASAYNLLGIVAEARGEYPASEGFFRRALDIYTRAGHNRKVVVTLQNLATTQRLSGDPELAIETLLACEPLLDPASNIDAWARHCLALGTAYFVQGDYGRAKEAFLKIDLPALEKHGLLENMVHATNNLGNVALKEQAWGTAREYLSYSAGISRRIHAEIYLGNTLGDLAEALEHLGEKTAALGHLDEAIELLKKHPENAWARKRLAALLAQRERLAV